MVMQMKLAVVVFWSSSLESIKVSTARLKASLIALFLSELRQAHEHKNYSIKDGENR